LEQHGQSAGEDIKVDEQARVTQLLVAWRGGRQQALAELMPLVAHTLHRVAARQFQGEAPGHTLQATALVNEAYLRLMDANVTWQDRAHFLAVAATAMRRILVDHARSRGRQKRGGDLARVTLYDARLAADAPEPDVLDLDEALHKLSVMDPRKGQVVEMSFFGGMTYDEIGAALEISAATVDRELRFAKAWLARELSPAS
jgi:RNA polymerase sigma factor (TIGR02999 family)